MKIYKNCKIITMNKKQPEAELMVVDDGVIIYIGQENNCPSQYLIDSEMIDLGENTVVPGFWESHLHLIDGMRSIAELNLRMCSSFKDFRDELTSYSVRIPENEWVIGHGWDEARIFDGKFPDRHLIDSICSSKPVILIRMDGHSLCTNTKAIMELKLNKLVESPELPFDKDKLPLGMVYENTALEVVEKLVQKLPDDYIKKLALKAQDIFLENGICSVNDICTKYGRYFDIYRKLQQKGQLKLRITASPYGLSSDSVEEFDDRIGEETDSLKIGPPKYFIDGSFGSRTALLYEAYSDDPKNYGLQLIDEAKLKEIIIENENFNKPINIHAIGDKAVGIILDCIEESRINNNRDIRSRIEHIQIIKESDIERFIEFDITASFQPVFLYETELTQERVGTERKKDVYRFKSFIDSGVKVIFNSDWPYGGGDFPKKPDKSSYIGFEPLLGIHAASCLNMNADENVTPYEALKCYTVNAAYANYREKELGMLAAGYFADFTVLSKNILSCSPEDIVNTKVVATVINGEVVYQSK